MLGTIVVPAEDVPTLRRVALADFSDFSEAAGDQPTLEGFAEHRDWADDAAQVLDVLGWDKPATTACRVEIGRTRTWAGALAGAVGEAVNPFCGIDEAAYPLALAELQSCVRLLGQITNLEVAVA